MIAGHVCNRAGAKYAYVIKHPVVQEHLTEPEAIGGGGDHVAMVEADRAARPVGNGVDHREGMTETDVEDCSSGAAGGTGPASKYGAALLPETWKAP